MHPVINLWPLNQFVVHNHFKLDGMHVVRDLLQKNDWMTRINLKYAYFSISIVPSALVFSAVQITKEGISVHMPTLWPFISPEGLHKDPLPSCGVPTQQRYTMCDLSGQYFPSRSGQGQSDGAHSNDLVTAQSLGFPGELPEISIRSNLEANFPRLHNQFNNEGAKSSTGKDGSDSQRGQGYYSGAPEDLSLISRPANRENVSGITMAIQLAPFHYRSLQNLKHIALWKKGYDSQIGLSLSARKT